MIFSSGAAKICMLWTVAAVALHVRFVCVSETIRAFFCTAFGTETALIYGAAERTCPLRCRCGAATGRLRSGGCSSCALSPARPPLIFLTVFHFPAKQYSHCYAAAETQHADSRKDDQECFAAGQQAFLLWRGRRSRLRCRRRLFCDSGRNGSRLRRRGRRRGRRCGRSGCRCRGGRGRCSSIHGDDCRAVGVAPKICRATEKANHFPAVELNGDI